MICANQTTLNLSHKKLLKSEKHNKNDTYGVMGMGAGGWGASTVLSLMCSSWMYKC